MNEKALPGIERREWLLLAVVLVLLIVPFVIRWMVEHPYAIHSDEAWYIDEAQIDLHTYQNAGLHRAIHGILHDDPSRPPAYRLVTLPFLILFGYHTVLLRVINFILFLVASWFLYLSAWRIASPGAGATAALIFIFSPTTLQACICYGTEGTLYLGLAAMFYFLAAYWSDAPVPPGNWIGLGLAVGLALLSKTTAAFIVGPALLCSLFVVLRVRRGLSGLLALIKAGLVAFLVAIPWWRVNLVAAYGLAKYASRDFPRHSLGPHSSLTTWLGWLEGFSLSLLGPGIGILLILVLSVYLRKRFFREESRFTPLQRRTVIVCVFSILPLLVTQLSGVNYLVRHISPVMVPLALAGGVIAQAAGWVYSKKAFAVSALLVSVQFFMLIYPVLFPNTHLLDPGTVNGYPWRVMIRFEQWDWKPLLKVSDSCGLNSRVVSPDANRRAFSGEGQYGWTNPIGSPKIAFLGNGRALNGSQIHFPWLAENSAWPDVTWLWRYEDGPIDWSKIMQAADQSDIVVTAPSYVGQITDRQDLDNQHNAEFATRLSYDPRFHEPMRLYMGQLDAVEVLLFTKKTLVCH